MKTLHTAFLTVAIGMALPLSALAASSRSGEFDDRWYLTAGAGANQQDSKRDTENAAFGTLGFGKFVNPRWSVDAELNYQNPKANRNEDLNFSQYGISFDARRHFRKEGRTFNPYIVGGVGYQRAHEEYETLVNSPQHDSRGYATAKLGLGVQADLNKVSFRGEIAARHSFDGDSVVRPDRSGFTDGLVSLAVVVPLGTGRELEVPVAPPIVPQQPLSCADLDDDGDGVSNCDDKCPTSQAGQTIGADGCPVAVTIDLRGVNFDFDQSTLSNDSRATLDEAVRILNNYPNMSVEVAGHTDSVGTEQYNQGLSERRARAVYKYLTEQGISANRLSGPVGYGELKPIAPNDTAEGRAQNRRTELNVQN